MTAEAERALAAMPLPRSIQKRESAPLEFTGEQRKLILDSFLNGATEGEAAVLLELAKLRRLNPITKQIHFVKRWDNDRDCYVWSAQVGIDGFRAIAERTGLYDGQDEAEYEYEKDGKAIRLCRVKVYRKDWSRPAVGVAHFSEYAQLRRDKNLTHMWATKPHVMLAKCAEALAFRKGFPEDTSGLYAPEEMPEVTEKEVNAPPRATPVVEPKRSAAKPAQTSKAKPLVDVQDGETEAQATARTLKSGAKVVGETTLEREGREKLKAAAKEPLPWERLEIYCREQGFAIQQGWDVAKALVENGTLQKFARRGDLDAPSLVLVVAELAKAKAAKDLVDSKLSKPTREPGEDD